MNKISFIFRFSIGLCLSIFILFGNACFTDNSNKHSHKHGAANAHLHNQSFEELTQKFEDPERVKWQKPYVVINMMGDLEGKTVADIGAGTGYFAFKMAALGAKVIAIDADKRFINFMDMKESMMKKEVQTNFETRTAEYDNPHLKVNEADRVLLVNTYHHIEDRVNYMQSLQKTLKPGGKIVIVDYKDEKTPFGPPRSMRLSAKEVRQELKKAGYQGVSVDEKILPYQYIIFAE